MDSLKGPNSYYQNSGVEQRPTEVSIKREIRERYEGHLTMTLSEGKSLGFHYPFDRQSELKWKKTHI